ncbi:hypothetical protein [Streptomyces sp. TLI_185]|uniref:hypothetical protein n=1 Tax=Streptomyces sp. TLI_185 TaxID=2485151 RepID=UPI000F4DD702|nr:hypothetical protein [Streptomyces sp. TLI_185]RPF30940.1 hypothetical protein EDD92_0755 [Streptomyces sp. TLI_185]
MRNSQQVVRSALTAAAAAALPLALAAVPAAAQGTGISVSTSGSTVSVTTSACPPRGGGALGTATLLSSSQPARQTALTGTAALQSAAWSNVSPGTYTVTVVCANGTPAGTQSVVVSSASTPTATPTATISATTRPSPSLGVRGGVGGAVQDYGPLTVGVGAALVGTGVIATGWYLRRRARPNRL